MSLDIFLRRAFGGKYKARRLALYQQYLTERVEYQKKRSENQKEWNVKQSVRAILKEQQRTGFDNLAQAQISASIETWLATKRSEKARQASRARWSRKRIRDNLIKKLKPPI
jgi:hypothetical protein